RRCVRCSSGALLGRVGVGVSLVDGGGAEGPRTHIAGFGSVRSRPATSFIQIAANSAQALKNMMITATGIHESVAATSAAAMTGVAPVATMAAISRTTP